MNKISVVYDEYKDILDEFGEERIQERFQDLYVAYDKFIKDTEIEKDVKLNTYTLMHAVLDYFTDISRLKKFHKIKKANSFKVTSYELSWLIRRKPIQILSDEKEELIYINEKFILTYVMSYFSQIVGIDFYEKLNNENRKVVDGFIKSFYYYLKYRNCSSQALEFALISFGAGVAATNFSLADKLREYVED